MRYRIAHDTADLPDRNLRGHVCDDPEKQLLLAAIEAAPNIRPKASVALLAAWTDSDDEDIADAVDEAMMVAKLESEPGPP